MYIYSTCCLDSAQVKYRAINVITFIHNCLLYLNTWPEELYANDLGVEFHECKHLHVAILMFRVLIKCLNRC